jgi:hypothetical protein
VDSVRFQLGAQVGGPKGGGGGVCGTGGGAGTAGLHGFHAGSGKPQSVAPAQSQGVSEGGGGHKKRRSTRGHKRRSTRAAESNAQGNLHQPAESAVQGGALGTRDDAVIFSGVIGPPTMSSSHVSAPVTVPWERAEPHAVVRRVKLELPGSWKNSMWTTSPPACVELVQLCVPSPSAVPQCPVVLW